MRFRSLTFLILTTTLACTSADETVSPSAEHWSFTAGVSASFVEACEADPEIRPFAPADLDDPMVRVAAVESALAELAVEAGLDSDSRMGGMLAAAEENLRRSLIEAEIGEISDEEIRDFYEANRDRLIPQTPRHLWAIFTEAGTDPSEEQRQASRARIEAAAERLAVGEEFATVAVELGAGPSLENRGDFGLVTPRDLPRSTRDLVWGLAEGEISDIVDLTHGHALFRTTDWIESVVPPLEDVRETIVDLLRRQRLGAHRETWLTSVGAVIPEFAPNEPVSPESVILALGDEIWTEADLSDWIEDNVATDVTFEERAGHRLDFQRRIAERAYFEDYQPSDEGWFAVRWTARRNHLLTGLFIDRALTRNQPEDSDLQALLELRWEEWPFAIERLITTIVIPVSPGPGEEGLARYYLVERAEAQVAEVLERLDAGEDFGDVARDFSPQLNAAAGGNVGWIREPSRPMFDIPLAGTTTGDITVPQRFVAGFVIHHVGEIRMAALDDVRDTLLNLWKSHAAPEAFATLCAALDSDQEPEWLGLIEEVAHRSPGSLID